MKSLGSTRQILLISFKVAKELMFLYGRRLSRFETGQPKRYPFHIQVNSDTNNLRACTILPKLDSHVRDIFYTSLEKKSTYAPVISRTASLGDLFEVLNKSDTYTKYHCRMLPTLPTALQ